MYAPASAASIPLRRRSTTTANAAATVIARSRRMGDPHIGQVVGQNVTRTRAIRSKPQVDPEQESEGESATRPDDNRHQPQKGSIKHRRQHQRSSVWSQLPHPGGGSLHETRAVHLDSLAQHSHAPCTLSTAPPSRPGGSYLKPATREVTSAHRQRW